MPLIFLSPFVQNTPELPGGEEESALAGRIADRMEPLLHVRGVRFVRRGPRALLGDVIRESNAGRYDLHLGLQVYSPGPGGSEPQALYYPFSRAGRCAAETVAGFYKKIYPMPEKVRAVPNVGLAELTKTNAPAVMFCAGNGGEDGVLWADAHTTRIAENLTDAICHCFAVPQVAGIRVRLQGAVSGANGSLSLLAQPREEALLLELMPDGAAVAITGVLPGWYEVDFRGVKGYADARYVLLSY